MDISLISRSPAATGRQSHWDLNQIRGCVLQQPRRLPVFGDWSRAGWVHSAAWCGVAVVSVRAGWVWRLCSDWITTDPLQLPNSGQHTTDTCIRVNWTQALWTVAGVCCYWDDLLIHHRVERLQETGRGSGYCTPGSSYGSQPAILNPTYRFLITIFLTKYKIQFFRIVFYSMEFCVNSGFLAMQLKLLCCLFVGSLAPPNIKETPSSTNGTEISSEFPRIESNPRQREGRNF